MTKISIEVNADVLKFVESQGYDITKLDLANEGDEVVLFTTGGPSHYSIRKMTTNSVVHLFHVRRKIKYRDVKAPDDLGRMCEFSNCCNFPSTSTVDGKLYSLGLQRHGPGLAFQPVGSVYSYPYCRTRDEP